MMIQNNSYANLLIIADDFTGANDTGVQLTKKGANVNVYFDWKNLNELTATGIMVINTESRALPIAETQTRINELSSLSLLSKRPIYKKIDSTIRGNIGAEIETLMAATHHEIAIVVPAFPDMNRIVKNGICYVDNIELIKTEFASDPKTPISSSLITECITQQTSLKCTSIILDDVRQNKLAQTIQNEITHNNTKIIVIDAETNNDLALIAEQINTLKYKVLLVGSAGLINYLPIQYIKPDLKPPKRNNENMLVIAGSMSKITQLQIEHAAKAKNIWQIITIDIKTLLPIFTDEQLENYCRQITQTFNNNKNCIIRTCKDDNERHLIEQYCQQYHFTRKELGEHISLCLGLIVKKIEINNLFLTGGDIAIAIAKSLGATGFHLEGEVSPGVPYGQLIGKMQHDYRIFTKAGGFGEEDIFTKSLEFI